MADIETSNEILRDAAGHTVSIKERWDDEWEEHELLFCDWLTFTASPTVAAARLTWQYGEGLRQGEKQFGHVDPLKPFDPARWWIKIEIDQPDDADGEPVDPIRWFGRIEEDARNPEGAFADGVRRPAGRQTLLAYGLEVIFSRQPLDRCWYLVDTSDERELGRFLPINEPNQLADAGNRSANKGPQGTYVFAGDLDAAQTWSTRTFLEYLVQYHTPEDNLGNNAITVKIDPAGKQFLYDWDKPKISVHGKTFKQILDELLDRRRLLGYTIEVDPGAGLMGDDVVVIRPFNYLQIPIGLPGGAMIHPNPNQKSLDFDAAVDIDQASLKISASQTFDQVVAVGEQIVCCGSISYEDGTNTQHWNGVEEAEYEAAASGEADYPEPDEIDMRQQRNADYRASEHLRRVYSYFGLPYDWDGKVKDGTGGPENTLFPYDELNLDENTDAGFWLADLRFERQLPLTDGDQAPAGQKYEYRRPYVVIRLLDEIVEDPRWGQVELLAACHEVENTGDGAGRDWCCSVRMQEDGPGIVLRVNGAPQHTIAYGTFWPLVDDVLPVVPFLWTTMIATIAVKADYHVVARYPDKLLEQITVVRTLRIDAGDRAKLHYVAPGTVIGLNDGKLDRHAGGFERDDRTWLSQVAGVAYEWYCRQRQAFSLSYRQASNLFVIGDLITSIGSGATKELVRTVITEVRIDLAQTENDVHRTGIRTQWAEMDVLQLM